MPLSKINLSEKRNFGDQFTTTFLFIKQEFKSILVAFAILIVPLILVELFLQSYLVKDVIPGMTDSILEQGTKGRLFPLFVTYLLTLILAFWLQLFGVAYLRLYVDQYKAGEEIKITWQELLKVMWRYLGKVLRLNVIYLLVIVVGVVFFIIPGIYVAVIFMFGIYFMMIRDKKMSSAFAASVDLCHGQWWSLFGYLILFQLIVSMLNYVFLLPFIVVMAKNYFTGGTSGVFELKIVTFIGQLGRYLMNMILVVGIGVRFFSSLEGKEHQTLLDKIGQIGSEEQVAESEEKL